MILDKVFHGVLDQGRGCLLVFDEPEVDSMYGSAIEMLEQVGNVVASLYAKVSLAYMVMLTRTYCFLRPQKSRNDTGDALYLVVIEPFSATLILLISVIVPSGKDYISEIASSDW